MPLGDCDVGEPSAVASLPASGTGSLESLSVSALGPAEQAQGVTVEIADASGGGEGGEEPNPELFNLIVRRGGEQVESFENLTMAPGTGRGRSPRNVAAVVNEASTLIRVAVADASASLGLPERRPASGTYNLAASAAAPVPAATKALAVAPRDFEGSAPDRTGMGGLEAADDVTMLLAPDLMAAYQAGAIDLEGVQAVQTAMIVHCERMGDRVAILDAPPIKEGQEFRGMKPQELQNWRVNVANYDSSYAALYYPWIRVFDPVAGKSILVPPSGHMAGIWARNDNTRGVHKAPANEIVRGDAVIEVIRPCRLRKGTALRRAKSRNGCEGE